MLSVTALTTGSSARGPRSAVTVVRAAATLLACRPGLAFVAVAPELVVTFVDVWWIEPLPDRWAWLGLLWLPAGAGAFAWTLALLAAAWEADDRSPVAIVFAHAGVLARASLLFLVVFLAGLPLVFPALYYGVHYFYFPILAVRAPARRAFALFRRSKQFARRHRAATWTIALASLAWNAGLPFVFDAFLRRSLRGAALQAGALAAGNLFVAAVASQYYARWKSR